MTAKRQARQTVPPVPFPWLTVEVGLWALLLVISLGLRLLRLDAAPLNAVEARDALAVWRFSQGQGGPQALGYSPLLFSAQWFNFLVFGANDVTARLLPAVAGTALTLTPALLRQHFGRIGALAAGMLLALSPTALTLSRTASGDVLVALGTLLFAIGIGSFLKDRLNSKALSIQCLPLSATVLFAPVSTALMLVSSPLAYSALLSAGIALLLIALADSQNRKRLQSGWTVLRTTPRLTSYMLAALLGSLMLLGTGFAWHFEGLAAASDLMPQWLRGFVRWPDSPSLIYPVLILLFYEPLITLVGGVGVAVAFVRGNAFSLFTALWSITALLLALIRPGHSAGDVLLVLVPLACLAGLALEVLFEGLRRRGHWLNEGLYLVVSATLWAYLVINLATYTSRSGQYTYINLPVFNISLPTYLSLVGVAVLLLLLLAMAIGFVRGPGPALRGLGLSIVLALLVYTIATTWGVSQNRPADPRELLTLEPTATEVRLLRESLARASIERYGDAHAIDVTMLTDDPALNWVLREFIAVRVTNPIETPSTTSAVIAPTALGIPPLGGDYIGQSFPLRRRWRADSLACGWIQAQTPFDQMPQLECGSLVEWLGFRRSRDRPVEEQVVLWLRQDLATDR